MPKTTITEFTNPIFLKTLNVTIEDVSNNKNNSNEIIETILKTIQNVDLEAVFKHDIRNGADIKRRLHRIKIIIGQKCAPNWNDDIIKEWERCVQSNLNMTKRELLRSIDLRRIDKTIFDVMDEIPEYKKIGVDILIALERKYGIPPALYSVDQVRQIGALRREFDQSIIRCMSEQEFIGWANNRCMDAEVMFEGSKEPNCRCFNYGQYKIYLMFAKKHPELIPEQQLKYLSEMELINICNRAINDVREGDVRLRDNYGKFFPLSDRKHDTKLLKDSFINIVLRCLIA